MPRLYTPWKPHSLKLEISLPKWISAIEIDEYYRSHEDVMRLAIVLSRYNVLNETGGPFGAVVAEKVGRLWRIVSVGVNRVVKENCSLLHAEALALMYAQKKRVKSFDLSRANRWLFTSGAPCIQCYGNIWWAGLRGLAVAARARDVEKLTGFNEGNLPRNWKHRLEHHPTIPAIVVRDLLRDKACDVLASYKGLVYNAGATRKTKRKK